MAAVTISVVTPEDSATTPEDSTRTRLPENPTRHRRTRQPDRTRHRERREELRHRTRDRPHGARVEGTLAETRHRIPALHRRRVETLAGTRPGTRVLPAATVQTRSPAVETRETVRSHPRTRPIRRQADLNAGARNHS